MEAETSMFKESAWWNTDGLLRLAVAVSIFVGLPGLCFGLGAYYRNAVKTNDLPMFWIATAGVACLVATWGVMAWRQFSR